jgi:hypothetical protein
MIPADIQYTNRTIIMAVCRKHFDKLSRNAFDEEDFEGEEDVSVICMHEQNH